MPEIPASLSAEVYEYTVHKSADLMAWHPMKREILVRTYGYGPHLRGQVCRVSYPGARLKQITFFGDPISWISYPPTDGDYLVFGKDNDGDERYQMCRYDPQTRKVTLLTDGKARNISGFWSYSGRWIAYFSTRQNGKDSTLHLVDPSNPPDNRLLTTLAGEGWSIRGWTPDDRRLVLGQYLSDRESYLWLLDVATGKKQPLTPRDPARPDAYGGGVVGPDGRSIYVLSQGSSEFWRLASLDLVTRRQTVLSHQTRWDVSSFSLARDGKTIAYVTDEDGCSRLHLLDTASRRELPVPQLRPGVITRLRWRNNGKELGFTFESAHFQPDAYSLDVRTGSVTEWTDSRRGRLHPERYPDPERIQWRSFDGRSISGYLYRPTSWFTGKRPVIIEIHGGPESQSRPGYLSGWNYYINELGIAMIFPNIRGSSGYGKTFLDLDNGFRRVDAYRDIGALLDWIRSRPDLDASRVMVSGGSYGGHVALAVAAMYNDRIRCTMDLCGPSNLVTLLENGKGDPAVRRPEYGDERDPRMRGFLERIAPLNNARKIRKPLFVVQGANDPRVPLGEAEQMVEAVRRNGTPVWYLMAWNEGHGFFKPANINYLCDARALFVKEYLLK